jgi:DNA-binding NarL/FixJ family response regulator
MVRERLKQVFEMDPVLTLCGETDNATHAMKTIPALQPDLVVTGLGLRNSCGLSLISELRSRHPEIKVLVLSSRHEAHYVERALRAGARGYVAKQEPTGAVIEAIRRVIDGELYLTPGILKQFVPGVVSGAPAQNGNPRVLQPLSRRESRVFDLIGQGYGTSAIASKLGVNLPTISTYRVRIKRKLQLNGRDDLLQAALQWRQSRIPPSP